MRRAQTLILVLALAALVARDALATNGARPIATGARAGGRGGVDTGIADDATALNTNPGGIGFIDGQRFDSATTWVHPDINAESPTDRNNSVSNTFGGSLAVAFDFEEPWHLGEALLFEDSGTYVHEPRSSPDYQGNGLKLGFGIFPLKGNRLKLNVSSPFWEADPQAGLGREVPKYQSDVKELTIVLGVAWRVAPWLSIGLAPGFIYGEVNQNSPLAEPASVLQGHPLGTEGGTYQQFSGFVGQREIIGYSKIHHARTYGARFRLGALLQPVDWFSAGISYASPGWKLDYLGTSNVDFSRQMSKIESVSPISVKDTVRANVIAQGDTPTDSYAGDFDLRLTAPDEPQEISLGVAFRLPYITLGLDLTWINWSGTYKKLSAELTNGTSPELNELTGDRSTTAKADIPLNWDDQVVFAVGLAFAPVDWMTIRAGYNYGKNPVPADTLQPTLAAIVEHHVTAGVSFYVKRLEFTFNFEQDIRAKQTVRDSISNTDLNDMDIDIAIQFFTFAVGARF